MPGYDVFLSYRSLEREHTDPLVQALEDLGLNVFRDDRELAGSEDIPRAVREALADSRLLVAWATPAWWESPACQWELQAAAQVAQAEGGLYSRRVRLVLPPGVELGHLPDVLRHARVECSADPQTRAEEIKNALEGLETMAKHLEGELSRWVGPRRARAPRFVGRNRQLWELHSLLQSPEQAALMGFEGNGDAVVHGLGGMGKSLLASQYALTFGRGYPGGVVWLDAARFSSIDEAYELVFGEVSDVPFPNIPDEPPGRRSARLRGALQRALGMEPLLWVVDDPDRQNGPKLSEWQCPVPSGRTLVTQRGTSCGSYAGFHLRMLSRAAAVSLLSRDESWGTTSDPEYAAVHELATALGRHALALDLAGLLMRGWDWTPSQFLDELRDQEGVLAGLELFLGEEAEVVEQELPTAHVASIKATLGLSYSNLGAEAQALLRCCADLAPDPVPRELFCACLEALGVDKKYRQAQILSELKRQGVALPHQDQETFEVHTLMRQVASRLWEGEGLPRMREAMAARMVSNFEEVEDLPAAHVDVAHLEAHGVALAFAGGQLHLAEKIGRLFLNRGAYGRGRALVLRLLATCRETLGEEHPDTLSAMQLLGELQWGLGEYAVALETHQETLTRRKVVLGEEHAETLLSMACLGNTLLSMGKSTDALALHESVLEVRERVIGAEDPATLTAMGNLANTLRAKGEHAAARVLQERVLSLREPILGAEHPDTLRAMGNLASTLDAQGEHAAARVLEERALGLRERVLGAEHPDTLRAMGNLASTLGAQGDHAAARGLEERALVLCERVLGTEHPETLTAMGNLANTLGAQGEYAAARELQERVLSLSERVLGAEHPETLRAMGNLASTLGAQGEHAAARALQKRVLSLSEGVLGAEHPETLTAMGNLASTLGAQGEHAAARVLDERVLTLRERVLGAEHPATLTAKGNLASTLGAQGEHAAARVLEEEVVSIRERVLGAEHPDTLTGMNNLAFTLRAQGEYAAARGLQERVLSFSERALGAEHPDTLTAMNNLAGTLGAQGEHTGARGLQERVLVLRERVLGAEHPDTLAAMGNLAVTLGAQGEHTEARGLQERVLSLSERVLGAEHPETLTAMGNLASTLGAQGEHAAARVLKEQLFTLRERVLGAEHPATLMAMHSLAVSLWNLGKKTHALRLAKRATKTARGVLPENAPVRERLEDLVSRMKRAKRSRR